MNWTILIAILAIIFLPAVAAVVYVGVFRLIHHRRMPLRIPLQINQLVDDLKDARPWIRFYSIPGRMGIYQVLFWGNSAGDAVPFAQMRVEKVNNRNFLISWYADSVRRVLKLQIYRGYPGFRNFLMPGHYEGFHVCGNRIWQIGMSFRSPLVWAWCDVDKLEIRIRYKEHEKEYYELHSRKYGLLMTMRSGLGVTFHEEVELFVTAGRIALGELEYRKIAHDSNRKMYLEIIVIMMFIFLLMRHLMKRSDINFRRWFRARDDYEKLWG